jgi:hypothetical protein
MEYGCLGKIRKRKAERRPHVPAPNAANSLCPFNIRTFTGSNKMVLYNNDFLGHFPCLLLTRMPVPMAAPTTPTRARCHLHYARVAFADA